jgi:glycosyltransferase involved in cell wall biosynthesis
MAKGVLFLHGSASGYGADRQLLALATGLDRDRYRPIVVLPEPGRLGANLDEAGIETHFTELATIRRGLLSGRGIAATVARLARNRVELARLARSSNAAIVHSNTSIILAGAGVASAAGAAHVLYVREIFANGHGRAGALWPPLRRHLLKADALICVSQAAASQFSADSNSHVRVVHDGVIPHPPPVSRKVARRELGLPEDAPVVAIVGRVSDWKGQHLLAAALARDPLASVGAIGVVAGDAAPGQEHFERELAGLGDRLGLGKRLRPLGFRDDVETVLGAADIFAAPSTHPDSLPNAPLEAAAAGLPVVACIDGGGITEIVRDGVTGRLVPAGDAEALARALAELIRDPERGRRMGAAASADVAERFAVQRMLEAVQACYDEVA